VEVALELGVEPVVTVLELVVKVEMVLMVKATQAQMETQVQALPVTVRVPAQAQGSICVGSWGYSKDHATEEAKIPIKP
jgi:hypothetical protein